MNLKRIASRISRVHGHTLPVGIVKVSKGEDGKRIVDGKASFVDSFPDIPFGYTDHWGDWHMYSRAQREQLHLAAVAKAERAAKRAAKGEKVKPVKEAEPVRDFAETMAHIAAKQVEAHTVKRDGKWVQVGSDNLTAFIENR